MPTIKVKSNAKDYIKLLKKTHGALPIVSAETVNTAGKFVKLRYQKELDQFTLRNKFTRGSVATLLSKAKSKRTGDFRRIRDINAIVGVRKLKGGKDHYLLDQEEGGRKRGTGKTKGFVAMPMDTGRTSKRHRKPIKSALRLQKTPSIQTLKAGGDVIGLPGSKFGDRQSWAIFHKYSGTSKSGVDGHNRYGWDLAKQFFFKGIRQGLSQIGVFKKEGKSTTMTRSLGGKTVRVRARHKFAKAVSKLTPRMMEIIFNRESKKFLR